MQNHEHNFEQNQEEEVDSIVSWCKHHYKSFAWLAQFSKGTPLVANKANLNST